MLQRRVRSGLNLRTSFEDGGTDAPCQNLTPVVFAWVRLHVVDEAMRSSAQPSSGVVEVGGEMRAQIASIVTSAVDQRGLAAPQELHPH